MNKFKFEKNILALYSCTNLMQAIKLNKKKIYYWNLCSLLRNNVLKGDQLTKYEYTKRWK